MLKPFAVLALATLAMVPAMPVLAEPTPEVLYQRTCANVLNLLPRIVRKADVAAIASNAHIVLHSICGGVELSDFGNAAGLRRTIAANTALSRALSRSGYHADQVVALAIHGDTVEVYVHRDI